MAIEKEEINLKEKVLLFIDEGLFFEFALKLSEEYKEVLYFTEWKNAFPGMPEAVIGSEWEDGIQLDTFDGKPIRRIQHLFDHVHDADIICMPDVYRGDMAEFFRGLGKPVFNGFGGEEIETDKWGAKEYFKEIGMDVIPAKRIIGVDALRKYLQKEKSKKWIKIGGGYRKYCETFSHTDWQLTELKLDALCYKWGPVKNIIEFIVEDDLDGEDVYEEGYDGFVISGKFPEKAIAGCEIKGCSYAGKLFDYKDLSKGIREINEALAPFFEKVKYNGCFSDEIRTKGDKHYLTDPCCRAGNPPTAVCIEMYKNYGRIVWDIAHGVVPDVEAHKEYGMQLLLGTYWGDDDTNHQALFFPPEIRYNVKIKNCLKVDGQYYTLKTFEGSGGLSAVAIGNSFEDCKKQLEKIVPQIKYENKDADLGDLDKAIEQFQKMTKEK